MTVITSNIRKLQLSARTAGFQESVIREMTRIGAEVGGVDIAQGLPNFDPPQELPPDSLELVSVRRSDLARGAAMAPPESITVNAVLEHAVRHLAWLRRDDPAISTALADWSSVLEGYVPEPFRALS